MLENWRQQRGLASGLPQYRKESLRVPFVPAAKVAAFNSTLTDVNSTARPLAQHSQSTVLFSRCNLLGGLGSSGVLDSTACRG